jgi:hypothetical protein
MTFPYIFQSSFPKIKVIIHEAFICIHGKEKKDIFWVQLALELLKELEIDKMYLRTSTSHIQSSSKDLLQVS